MDCFEAIEKLHAYLDQDVESCSCEEILKHLQACRCCWSRFEFERVLRIRVKRCCQEETVSQEFIARIETIIDDF